MITSWNVNEFCGGEKAAINCSDVKDRLSNQKQLNVFFEQLMKYLVDDNDVLLLHEFPYKRIDGYEEFQKAFLSFLKENELEPICPLYSGSSYFRSIAVVFKKSASYELCYDDVVKLEFGSYRNRVIALRKKSEPTEIIVGVHIPISKSIDYWNSLILTHRKIMKNNPEYRFIYIGDMNTYKDGTVNKMKLTEFMDEGLKDFWLESGHSHNAEVYPDATTYVYVNRGKKHNERLDYVLVTGKDFDKLNKKYDMTVDHTVRVNGLSDHSAIILKEKTPETKKTGELK
ncbi:hypothetical protein RASY3_06245 [Ruminococcus albus SY3]|uniref:Endonuclease/exonuclease/phosphatase domain-containing protein n=1 Tax=Ruminococcus albus SY3 TaxID=1341156 RepID=A0A011UHJ0_RUMAL|nr:endonuclease/exonuclease/phosphatase family protein [Ruminococcus albus]EXM40134.1 hypothetical protein RASY3_06245 [Ruminococcus albus SY3]